MMQAAPRTSAPTWRNSWIEAFIVTHLHRGLHRAPGREQIVEHHDALTGRDRVVSALDLEEYERLN